jgi:tRNA1Val (adenine37-N6)-methyltransferase
MANLYFRFKQFTVWQDRCAMKVGTDGVLLGAWADPAAARRILDIGCGSGLIALMLAQRSKARIDAVDIDHAACRQAEHNRQCSPWADRIAIHHAPIQTYASECRYDLAVANPPYFTHAGQTARRSRAIARHDGTLKQAELLEAARRLLSDQGRLAVIYPLPQARSFERRASGEGWFCRHKLHIKPLPDKPVKRVLLEFVRQPASCREDTMALERARHVYTEEFIALIRDFYLKY